MMPQDNETGRREKQSRPFVDRRKRKDWVAKSIPYLSVAGWGVAIMAILLLDQAGPKGENLFTRLLGTPVKSTWNTSMVYTAFIALVAAFSTCAIGFLFNLMRHSRKSDKFSKSVMILGACSLVGLILFMIRFSSLL